MKEWAIQLAKDDLENQNPTVIGSVIGTVISAPPNLQISILNGSGVLYKEQLYVNELLGNYTRDCKVNGIDKEMGALEIAGTIEIDNTLKPGDKVKVSSSADEQIWFVEYKVKGAI